MTLINLTNKNDFQANNFLFIKNLYLFVYKYKKVKVVSFLFKVFKLIYKK